MNSRASESFIGQLADKLIGGAKANRREALALLELDRNDLPCLFAHASRIRRHFLGNRVHVCAILNVKSGACPEDCAFCAQSAHATTGTAQYGLLEFQQVAQRIEKVFERVKPTSLGLVTSGRCSLEGAIRLASQVSPVVASKGAACCASFGQASTEEARRLKQAGIRCFNHNLETSENYFSKVCTTHTFKDRVKTVNNLREGGLSLCVGGIVGMGETAEDRVDLALAVRELGADKVPLNFLNPIPGTRFVGMAPLHPLDALKILAMFRFVLPDRHIKVAGGREAILGDFQSWMFLAGGSGFIIGDYLTTQGRSVEEDLRLVERLGLEIE